MTWIKMRKSLKRDGRVLQVSRLCNAPPLQVVGALYALWSLADDFIDDEEGFLRGYTPADLDREVGIDGFTTALPDDWLEVKQDGLYLPQYQEHNGSTAKARAQNQKRVATHRKRKCNGSVTPEALPEESRLEERESRGEETVNALSATPALNEKNTLLKLSALKFSPAEIFDMQAKYTPERIENVLDWWQGLAAGKKKGKPAAQVILATLARHSKPGEVTDLGMVETLIESKRANR